MTAASIALKKKEDYVHAYLDLFNYENYEQQQIPMKIARERTSTII